MWVLPTAGRPDLADLALTSLIASGISTPGVVVVDGDKNPAYREIELPAGWTIEYLDENAGPLAIFQAAFEAHPDEPWYGWLADDVIARSGRGWDHELIAKAGPRGIASPNDLWLDGRRITWGAVWGGELVRAVGWWMPPKLRHLFADDVWEMIGYRLGLWRYVEDVVVEHRHPFNSKREIDETHRIGYSGIEKERKIFEELRRTEIVPAIARVRQAFGMPIEAEKARYERARSRSVMLGVPIHGTTEWQFSQSLAMTTSRFTSMGIKFTVHFLVGSSNLPRARNGIVEAFLRTDCDDLIFIDSDMGWEADDAVRLLASEQEVIGGVGRKKGGEKGDLSSWCLRLKEGSEKALNQDDFGAIEVDRIGTGFLKISRTAFEKIAAAHPQPHREGKYYRYFEFGPNDDGEDYMFCALWQASGGKVWADIEIELAHAGAAEWRGRFADLVTVAGPLRDGPSAERFAEAAE
jgi:hypothetical protein